MIVVRRFRPLLVVFSVVLSTEMESDVALFFTPDLTGFGTQTYQLKGTLFRSTHAPCCPVTGRV